MQVEILGPNVCVIHTESGTYLQSYKSIVAFKGRGGNILYPNWRYSRTTSKHVSRFFGFSCTEIMKKIKKGEYGFREESTEPEL